jgi:hypothetical protein
VAASGLKLRSFNPRSQSRPTPGGFGFWAFLLIAHLLVAHVFPVMRIMFG